MVWFIIAGFVALFVAGIALIAYLADGWSWPVAALFIPLIVLTWVLSLFAYNRALDYQTGKCAQWGTVTGYQTKYVNVGYGDWTCYGKTDAEWLPIDQIRQVN